MGTSLRPSFSHGVFHLFDKHMHLSVQPSFLKDYVCLVCRVLQLSQFLLCQLDCCSVKIVLLWNVCPSVRPSVLSSVIRLECCLSIIRLFLDHFKCRDPLLLAFCCGKLYAKDFCLVSEFHSFNQLLACSIH